MGRQKEELSIFEQMGGTYTEKDGILYPNIRIGEEETEAMQNTFSGKYGDLWKKYLKENQTERYYHLVHLGQLKQKAEDVRNVLSELSVELKKQGVNINQIAKILNTYGGMDMKQSLEYTEYRYKQIENGLLSHMGENSLIGNKE